MKITRFVDAIIIIMCSFELAIADILLRISKDKYKHRESPSILSRAF